VDEAAWREALAQLEGPQDPGEQVDPEMVAAVQEAFRNRTGPKIEIIDSVIDDDQRRETMLRELEYKRARRCAHLVRAAGEAIPLSDAPAVTPDTVWSGDFGTLVSLVKIGLYRMSMAAAYMTELNGPRCSGSLIGFLSRTSPARRISNRGVLDRNRSEPAHDKP
jgi:hypothetical protein